MRTKPTKAMKKRKKSLNPFRTRLSAHVTEEGEWVSGPPNLTLSRMFLVVLLLHIVIVGGILTFEMLKADPIAMEEDPATPLTGDPNALPGSEGLTLVAAGSYRVRAGDTLSQIANAHEVSSGDLTALNGLRNGDQIYPGQKLLIPAKGAGGMIPAGRSEIKNGGETNRGTGDAIPADLKENRGANVPPPLRGDGGVQPGIINTGTQLPPVEPAPTQSKTHTVADGETAYAISRKYGVTVDALLGANGISDARFLRAGETIKIPE